MAQSNVSTERLLILACSQRKKADTGALPAIERYDGPAFRVLRKYIREEPRNLPFVLILSAKYGLIEAVHSIPDYDVRMSSERARKLRASVLERLATAVRSREWQSIGVCVGQGYAAALDGADEFLPKCVEVLGGGQGPRLAKLHRWLRDTKTGTS